MAILRDEKIPPRDKWSIFQHLKSFKFAKIMPKPVNQTNVIGTDTLKLTDFILE